MKKGELSWLRELAYYSSIGFSVALSIFIGLAIGLYVDKKFGYAPFGMIIFLFFGIIAGFRNIAIAVKKTYKK